MRKEYSIHKSLSYVFRGGIATSAMDTLATGPILIAYAAFFGAGNLTFGILGSIPYLGNLIHLFAAWLIEKGFSVRKISIWSSFISRPFYLLAALLAFNPNMHGALFFLVLFLSAAYLIGGITGGAWLPWMKILVPEKLMARFFAHRFKYMMFAKIICFLGAYFFLEHIHKNCPQKDIYAYSFLLILAFIIGLYGTWTFLNIKDCPVSTCSTVPFIQKVKLALKYKPFQRLLTALSILNFSQAFITPFLTVFMLKRLELNLSVILIFNLILQTTYMLTIKKWGKIADHKGVDTILMLSVPLFISVLVGLIVLNQITSLTAYVIYMSLVILHVILGIATAGLTLGINNASLLFVPSQMAAIYLSVNSAMKSLAGAIGSLVAGITLSFCIIMEQSISSNPARNGWTSFFIIAILLCLLGGYLIKCLQNKRLND